MRRGKITHVFFFITDFLPLDLSNRCAADKQTTEPNGSRGKRETEEEIKDHVPVERFVYSRKSERKRLAS